MTHFANISPLDSRYRSPELEEFFSESAHAAYLARVEVALIEALAGEGLCSVKAVGEIKHAALALSAEAVVEEEKKTRHDIRALVNILREHVSDETKPWVHWGATSYDIRDTAHSLRMRDGVQAVLLPALIELEQTLIALARREKNTVQVGRTHGQHAVPVTVGFTIAEYVDRLGRSIQSVQIAAKNLKGKFSGAVGAHNSQKLFLDDPQEFEKKVLSKLNIEPAPYSTQIIPPEFMLDLLHHVVSAFGIIANIARDMRSLQRSEIGEVGESFASDQVGSSTMPQKRNPINFENIESLWKTFTPRMLTYYLDQVSEHQRDLTNSASSRFQFEIIAGLLHSTKRLNKVLANLVVDNVALQKNLDQSREMIIAEPLYLLLAHHGHPDAHEAVKQLTLRAQSEHIPLIELAGRELGEYIAKFTEDQQNILKNPEGYVGIAGEKTTSIIDYWNGNFFE